MKTYQQIGTELGELVDRKAAAYGDTVTSSEVALQLLYPDGIRVEHYADVLLIVRIFDKLGRIANDRTAFDESPFLDIAGYAIRGVHHHLLLQHLKDSKTWQGSASGPDASSSLEATQPASAEPPAKAATTTKGSEPSARKHSRRPAPSSAASPAPAAVQTAPEVASPSEADRRASRRGALAHNSERWMRWNEAGFCLACDSKLKDRGLYLTSIKLTRDSSFIHMQVCSQDCWDFAYLLLRDHKVEGAELA